MKKETLTDKRPPLTETQLAQLRALDGNPDTQEFPEAPASNWARAERGRFFKPRKEAVSLRIDADVLDWLRRNNDHYQSEINRILRKQMEQVEG